MWDRDGLALLAFEVFAGIPTPENEFVVGHVFDEIGDAAIPIQYGIFQHATQLTDGETLPAHRARSELPMWRAGYARFIVFIAVAGNTASADCAFIVRAPRYLHQVLMPIHSLARTVVAGVAIHASRMLQYRRDPGERIGGLAVRRLARKRNTSGRKEKPSYAGDQNFRIEFHDAAFRSSGAM